MTAYSILVKHLGGRAVTWYPAHEPTRQQSSRAGIHFEHLANRPKFEPRPSTWTEMLYQGSSRPTDDRGAPPLPPRNHAGAGGTQSSKTYTSTLYAGELGQPRTVGMRASSSTTVAHSVASTNARLDDGTYGGHGAFARERVAAGLGADTRAQAEYGPVSRTLLYDRPGPYTSTLYIDREQARSPGTRAVSLASDPARVAGTRGALSNGATYTEYTVGPAGADDGQVATAEPLYEQALPVDYARLHGLSWWHGSASIGSAEQRVPPYVPVDRAPLHDVPRGAHDWTDAARHDEVRTSNKRGGVIERGISTLRSMFAGIWNVLRHGTSHKSTPVELKLEVDSRTGVPPTIERASDAVLSSGPQLASLLGSPDTPSNRSRLHEGFLRLTYGMETFDVLAMAAARAGDVSEHLAQEIENLAAYTRFANGDTLVQLFDRMHRYGDYGFLANPLMQQDLHDYLGKVRNAFEKYAIATGNSQLLGNVLDASLHHVDASPGRYVATRV